MLYPVVINLLFFYVFLSSQFDKKTVIEEIAGLREDTSDPKKRVYLRVLNLVWCVFFLANACISGYVAYFRPISDWALYNGFVSYVLMGALLLGEIAFRPLYKRAVERHPD